MKKKIRNLRRTSAQYKDTHHIFWCRKDYQRGWAKKLRDHWYCRVDIPMNTLHHHIHEGVSRVPPPRAISIKDALYQLELLERHGAIHPYDNIEKRLYLLLALFDCCEPETYNALKKQYDIVRKHFHRNPR